MLVSFIWNTDIESVQEISPIRRDVGIVGGTHCYDWWLVNGTGVHGSLVPSPSFSRVGGRARFARGRKKKGLVHTVCACITKIS